MNVEFIEKHNKIYIDRTELEETYNYNLLNNILSTLGRYGYTLSIEAIDIFCKLEWNYRVNLLSKINKELYEKSKRDNEEISMFYVNYPNEVKSQDKRELYINSLLFFYHNFWSSNEEEFIIDKPELTSDIGLEEIEFTFDQVEDIKEEEERVEEFVEKESEEELQEVIIDNLEDMVEKIKSEDKEAEINSQIEAIERSLEEKEEERIVLIGQDESHFDQMELFHTDSLPAFDSEEKEGTEIEVEEEYIDTNENQLNIFDEKREDETEVEVESESEEEDPYTDEEEVEVEEEFDSLEDDENEEESEDDEDEDFEEGSLDSDLNPYDDEDSEEEIVEEDSEVYEESEKYKNFSPEEVQEAFDEYEDEIDELYELDQNKTKVALVENKREKRSVSEVDSFIENRRYLKLLKALKKEPNELTRRILFIVEGINYKYEDREDRIEFTSKALGIFEGIVDEVNSDVLREVYYKVKDKEHIYSDKGLYKAYKELRKIIKEEIKDRS